MSRDRWGKVLGITCLLAGGIGTLYFSSKDKNKLLNSNVVINGVVYDHIPGNVKAPGTKFKYLVVYKGKKYYATSSVYYFRNNYVANEFVNKYFPVALDTSHPENNQLLITPKEFAEFRMLIPDSLRWVQKYLN